MDGLFNFGYTLLTMLRDPDGLRMTVALAVGVALVVGVFRILKGWPVQYLIIGGYLGVVIMTFFAPPEIIGIAYDFRGRENGLRYHGCGTRPDRHF